MSKLTCPKDPAHTEFETVALIQQVWAVGTDGDWIRTLESSLSSKPDFHGNDVTCLTCGEKAKVA